MGVSQANWNANNGHPFDFQLPAFQFRRPIILLCVLSSIIPTATANYLAKFQGLRSAGGQEIGGTDSQGNAGPSFRPWSVFSQRFRWLLPFLALVSQLPSGGNNRVDNVMSVLLNVGSLTLGAYSLIITALHSRWISEQFSHITYPNVQSTVQIMSRLQQLPLNITTEDGLLASLIVLPENDWWSATRTALLPSTTTPGFSRGLRLLSVRNYMYLSTHSLGGSKLREIWRLDMKIDGAHWSRRGDKYIRGAAEPQHISWATRVMYRMFVASVLALILTWGTVSGAVIIEWFTPMIGLSCRSGSFLIYATVSTLVWILLVLSSVPNYTVSTHRRKGLTARVCATIALHRISKILAAMNALWIVLICLFQFTGLYDTCWCNSSVLHLGSRAYSLWILTPADIQAFWPPFGGATIIARFITDWGD
ncbi:hypothetical protein B0H10DRAFT_1940513 [Mycena sp. CBHHK59/15]|nr:hypothetical protein B0H10DRAFT_1940513 [Mycena sp. CBHHK59/15]